MYPVSLTPGLSWTPVCGRAWGTGSLYHESPEPMCFYEGFKSTWRENPAHFKGCQIRRYVSSISISQGKAVPRGGAEGRSLCPQDENAQGLFPLRLLGV